MDFEPRIGRRARCRGEKQQKRSDLEAGFLKHGYLDPWARPITRGQIIRQSRGYHMSDVIFETPG